MKNSDLKALLRKVLNEELNEMMHPDDAADMQGDGYSNQSQRAFAHSQMTTPIPDETGKAKELAKQGKYVVLTGDNVHCKSTDAVLGCSKTIVKVCNSQDEANAEVEKLHSNDPDIYVDIISPESLKPKQQPPAASSDDVPFEEGYGAGDMKKDKKKAFPKSRWTVKFNEIKSILKDVINEELNRLTEATEVRDQPVPQDRNKIFELITGLPDGYGISFYQSKYTHFPYVNVEKRVEGDEQICKYTTGDNWHYLDLDDPQSPLIIGNEIYELHSQIYEIYKIQGYSKPARYPEDDDQDVGEYTRNGPDPIEPQFESADPSQITPEIIQAMRNWAKDCQWRDVSDEAEIDEMPDAEIVSGVAQNYDGGIEAFIADSQPTHANQQVAELYEAKGGNKKQKIVNLIKETIQEVMQEEGQKTKAELIKLWGGPNWISSPVPSGVPNEFVVKWMVNGKRDENKCYYTDDKQDAQDTYLAMSKTAMEMNLALQTGGQ